MSSVYDLHACVPPADSTATKFPIAPYASAGSYLDAYAAEFFRAAKTIDPAAFDRAGGHPA